MRDSVYKSPSEIEIQQDDIEIAFPVDTINFEGGVSVVDDGGNKVTVTVTAGDVFANALFSQTCEPLFEKRLDGTVNLLERCV